MNLCRTLLFMPGNRPSMLEKGLSMGADALLPDLEDSVPNGEKEAARAAVRHYIQLHLGRQIYVRINAISTNQTRRDLEAVVTPGLLGVFLAKVESVDDVRQTESWLEELERSAGMSPGSVEIVCLIESALGVVRGYDIASASPRVASLCLGGAENGDLQRDLGADWSEEGTELMYSRSKLLVDARAAGIQFPLDTVYANIDDQASFAADTMRSKRLGFKGRPVIHPRQIGPANAIYTPTAEQVEYYLRLLRAFDSAVGKGKGSIKFEGKLVDFAMAANARKVLELARTASVVDTSPSRTY